MLMWIDSFLHNWLNIHKISISWKINIKICCYNTITCNWRQRIIACYASLLLVSDWTLSKNRSDYSSIIFKHILVYRDFYSFLSWRFKLIIVYHLFVFFDTLCVCLSPIFVLPVQYVWREILFLWDFNVANCAV